MQGAPFGLGLLLLTGCAETTPLATSRPVESSRPEAPPGPRAVIVVPFDASSLPPEQRWIGEGVAQIISLGLVQHPTIVQIERSRVRAVSDADAWTETLVTRAGRVVHADAALFGRIRRAPGELIVEPRLLETRTGRVTSLPTMAVADIEFLLRATALPVLYALELQPAATATVSPGIAKAAHPTSSLRAFEFFARGQAAFYRGDGQAAVNALVRAIEADPQFVAAQYTLGVVHLALGNRWKAAAQFRASVQLDPRMPEPYKALGYLFFEAPRPLLDYAIEAYSRAIDLRPFYADAYVGLGETRAAKGDPDGALAAYQKAVTFDPFNPGTHVRLGRIWAARGLCAEAANADARARELDPSSPDVRCAR